MREFTLDQNYTRALNALVSSKTKSIWRECDQKLIQTCEEKFKVAQHALDEFRRANGYKEAPCVIV